MKLQNLCTYAKIGTKSSISIFLCLSLASLVLSFSFSTINVIEVLFFFQWPFPQTHTHKGPIHNSCGSGSAFCRNWELVFFSPFLVNLSKLLVGRHDIHHNDNLHNELIATYSLNESEHCNSQYKLPICFQAKAKILTRSESSEKWLGDRWSFHKPSFLGHRRRTKFTLVADFVFVECIHILRTIVIFRTTH